MKIAFVGAGRIAHFHYEAFKAAGAEIVAVCTRRDSGEEFAKKYSLNYYNNLTQLIETEKPEGVCLLTQPSSYPGLLKILKEKNIATFLEKPVSYNAKEGEELKAWLPKKTMIGQNRRFYSNATTVKKILQQQPSVTAHFYVCERAKDIRIRPEYDRDNWHTLNAIHGVDLMKYLFGAPKEIIHQDRWGNLDFSKLSAFNSIVYNSEDGHRVHYHSNFDSPGGWRIHIFYGETEITFSPIEQSTIKSYEGLKELPLTQQDQDYKQGFFRQAQCFIEGVRDSELPQDWVNFDDALDSVTLTEKIYGTL